MGIFTPIKRLFGREEKMTSLDLFREVYGGKESRSGVAVNWETALEVSTVLGCVRSIANGVAQVPWRAYQGDADSRTAVKDHPVYHVIYRRPNTWQTSFEFRETLMFHVLLTGNAYVFVNRVGTNREVHELLPLEPGRVEVKQNADYSLTYRVRGDNGTVKEFPQDAIWHLRGPSWNSWMGMEAVKMARDAIGLTIALEDNQSDFQKNGAKTSGLYAVKEKLSPEKYAMLREWFEKEVNKQRPLIVDQGASYTPFTMSGVDQQLIETRKHQIEEICRVFGVMPIMVGHADKTATYASAEQMFLAHVVHTLAPWYERIEQSADVNLLTEAERAEGYYTKFTPNALMRGAATDRASFYSQALGSGGTKGWMTQNEVRSFEELERIDDPEADRLPQPTNTQAEAVEETPADTAPE